MRESTKLTECPKGGGKELGKGKHNGYSVINLYKKMRFGSEVVYIICTDCGFIK